MKMRLLVVPAVLAFTLLAGCGDDNGSAEPPAGGQPSTSETTTPGETTTPSGDATCTWVTDNAAPAAKDVEPPPAKPVSAGELTIKTNVGDIKVKLDPANAPCAAGNFTWLASQGYFDDTKCHRLVIGFVLQCGDPSASGMGGPGYTFADELKGTETYTRGTLAMANAGPDTNGSQFFIVIKDSQLPPSYTVFGSVDDAGMKVVDAIEGKGNGPDGVAPAEDVVIKSVS